ncbi:GSU2403 family nucleotidyltransferase fold protein [Rhizobium terrae]
MISKRVETFKGEKSDFKARRKFVSTLTREAGLIAADRFTGDIVQALAKAGLFRLRGVLIGTVAFQCYSAYLGIRLPSAAILTGDADLAQDFAISAEVADSLPPSLSLPVAAKTTPAARPNGIKTLDRQEYYSTPCRSRAVGLHWLTLWRRHGIAGLLGSWRSRKGPKPCTRSIGTLSIEWLALSSDKDWASSKRRAL